MSDLGRAGGAGAGPLRRCGWGRRGRRCGGCPRARAVLRAAALLAPLGVRPRRAAILRSPSDLVALRTLGPVDLVVAALGRLPGPVARALRLVREVLPPGGHAVLTVGGRPGRPRGVTSSGAVRLVVARTPGRLLLLRTAHLEARCVPGPRRRRGHPRALARLGAAIRAAGLVPRRVLPHRRAGVVIVVERP